MPWFWRAKPAEEPGAPPPPSPEVEQELKDLACRIQACLKKASYDMAACSAEIDALRECCQRTHARGSVHCTAGWVGDNSSKKAQQKK